MLYSITHPQNGLIEYRETRRYLWGLVLLFIFFPVIVMALYLKYQNPWWLIVPLELGFILLPILDRVVGVDTRNPPEALVQQLEADPYYTRLLAICVPAHFVVVILGACLAGSQALSWPLMLGLAAMLGLYSGLSINTAHEIGHKATKTERLLSRIALGVSGYGHFCIDHNVGHHRDVATPDDPASSRMGESIYGFMLREIPGSMKRGWAEERKRLERRNLEFWSLDNHILQSYLITFAYQGTLVVIFGWPLLAFFLVHNFMAWFQLTSANYIEHYGLLREKKANGRYERCQPHHSWNANHYVSNLLLLQLQRHSDHHANPARSYQSLRSFPDLPELPSGYFGMYALAYIPPLWFALMNKRLLAVPHIKGDLDKINIDPKKAKRIRAKYAQ